MLAGFTYAQVYSPIREIRAKNDLYLTLYHDILSAVSSTSTPHPANYSS